MTLDIDPGKGSTVLRFRRKIALVCHGTLSTAALDDDFHGFVVTLAVDRGTVAGVSATARRVPWTTCPGALSGLQSIRGCSLTALAAAMSGLPRSAYCVHLKDLACLAAAQMLRGGARTYVVEVDVERDGQLAGLRVQIDGQAVVEWGAGDVSDLETRLRASFKNDARLAPEATAEAVRVAMRAVHVAGGRRIDFSLVPNAAAMNLPATCRSFHPDFAEDALPLSLVGRDPV